MPKLKFPRPEFFDIFGVFIFATIAFLSGWSLTTGDPIPRWGLALLFMIGVLGIFVDGSIVNGAYIKKK